MRNLFKYLLIVSFAYTTKISVYANEVLRWQESTSDLLVLNGKLDHDIRLAWSPDSKGIIVGLSKLYSDGIIILWDQQKNVGRSIKINSLVGKVGFSSGHIPLVLRSMQLQQFNETHDSLTQLGTVNYINDFAIGKQRNLLAVSHLNEDLLTYELTFYDQRMLSKINKLSNWGGLISGTIFSPNEQQLTECDNHKTIKVWDLRNLQQPLFETKFSQNSGIGTKNRHDIYLAYSNDGKNIIAGGNYFFKKEEISNLKKRYVNGYEVKKDYGNGVIEIFDSSNGTQKKVFVCEDQSHISALAVDPNDSNLIVVSSNIRYENTEGKTQIGKLEILNLEDETRRLLLQTDEPMGPAAFSPDGSMLAAVVGNKIKCWQNEAHFAECCDS